MIVILDLRSFRFTVAISIPSISIRPSRRARIRNKALYGDGDGDGDGEEAMDE